MYTQGKNIKKKDESRWTHIILSFLSKIGKFFVKHADKKILLFYSDLLLKSCLNDDRFMDLNLLFGLKFLCFILFSFFGFLFKINIYFTFFLFAAFGIFGFFIPDLFLKKIHIQRHEEFNRDLPYIIDLLNISILAGQNIYNSLRIITDKYEGNICAEIKRFLKAVDFGIGKGEAYNNFIAKNNTEDFKSLLFILLQAEKYGSPINEILLQKTKYLRFEMLQKYEQRSRKTSIILLFPLVFLILPAFMLLVGGPLVFSLAGSFY